MIGVRDGRRGPRDRAIPKRLRTRRAEAFAGVLVVAMRDRGRAAGRARIGDRAGPGRPEALPRVPVVAAPSAAVSPTAEAAGLP
jgi:hypothetical protein